MTTIGDILLEYKETLGNRPEPEILTLTEGRGFIPQTSRFGKRLATEDTSKYKVIHQNEFAFNPYLLWSGAIARNTSYNEAIISPLYPTFKVLNTVDPSYAEMLLRSDPVRKIYDQISFGSIPRRRRASVKDFLSVPLPDLPDLQEQRRISRTLSGAATLAPSIIQARATLDELLLQEAARMHRQAPTRHAKLSAIVESFVSGKSFPDTEDTSSNSWNVLRVGAVSTGNFNPKQAKPLIASYVPPESHVIHAGDLLINRSNTPELVGQTSFVWDTPPRLTIPDTIWKFHWLEPHDASPIYMWATLRTPRMRQAIQRIASGSNRSMLKINRGRMMSLEVPWPSREERQAFEAFASSVRRLQRLKDHQERLAQELHATLQYRAFRGEL